MSEVTGFNINGQEYDILSESGNGDLMLKYDNSTANLNIGDEDGNVLVQFKNGHIKTQNFDSNDINVNVEMSIDLTSKNLSTTLSSFTEGSMSISNPNCKNHYTLWFYANVNVMGTLKIRLGNNNAWAKGEVDITPTDIVEYAYATNVKTTTSHGLNITDNITICVKTTRIHYAQLTIVSGAETFTKEISWGGCGNGCSITNTDGDYTNCEFNLSIDGLLKDVWIFGDSYTDYWPLSLEDIGMTDFNFYIDGFSGRGSAAALSSFNKEIQLAKPKAIIWMMGMNDRDNGSVNSSWKTAFDSLYSSCENNGIELYCCTIPCVPARDHVYKNAYIESSGVNVIDVAAELGATQTGSEWYAGLLGTDSVHPSYSGSLRIAMLLLKSITYIQS